MGIPNPFQKQMTTEELEEEDKRATLQYSIEQKRAAMREAKKRGIKPSSFASISSMIKWFKTH
jgi:hypothetical protein